MFAHVTRPMRWLAAAAILTGTALPLVATPASAARSPIPAVHPRLFASPPSGSTKPDDITRLDGLLWVTYQNNAGKDGTPPGSMSTVVAFNPATGREVTSYQLLGRCDGLTADPINHRLLASVNEDNNSSFYVITPGVAVPAHYHYTPNPAETGTDGVLNGGTDAISVAPDGTIYIAHSNPAVGLDTAAVFTVTLEASTAVLTPLFGVNDAAHVINHAPGGPPAAPLGLTDPDSNRFVADRQGGTLIQGAQADSKLVLATHLGTHLGERHPELRQLLLTNAGDPTGSQATPQLDDIEEVTGSGVLYAVDQQTGNIFAIDTTADQRGLFFVSQPAPAAGDLPNRAALGVVDLRTGVVTAVDFTLGSPKGLLFVSSGFDR